VDVADAIRSRRTHKQYGSEPVDEATLRELLDLARHAPNHHLTQPWRFRVLGPETRKRIARWIAWPASMVVRKCAVPRERSPWWR